MSHAEHFESLEKQAHAARLGMWVFLGSEILLFGALFGLYASYRAHYPAELHEAMHHSEKVLGSLNTAILLGSSALVAASVEMLRADRRGLARLLLAGTMLLGLVFLLVKGLEYRSHVTAGFTPTSGEFWSLYYTMTGLHAVHVLIGIAVLSLMLFDLAPHRLEVGALYWHFVDIVWIFLWPLFYLA